MNRSARLFIHRLKVYGDNSGMLSPAWELKVTWQQPTRRPW